ncbi:hypothetical protein FHG87_024955, partial [Trinorchestia longiramus]
MSSECRVSQEISYKHLCRGEAGQKICPDTQISYEKSFWRHMNSPRKPLQFPGKCQPHQEKTPPQNYLFIFLQNPKSRNKCISPKKKFLPRRACSEILPLVKELYIPAKYLLTFILSLLVTEVVCGVPGATGTPPAVPGATGTPPAVPGATGTPPAVQGATGTPPAVPGATGTPPAVPGATGHQEQARGSHAGKLITQENYGLNPGTLKNYEIQTTSLDSLGLGSTIHRGRETGGPSTENSGKNENIGGPSTENGGKNENIGGPSTENSGKNENIGGPSTENGGKNENIGGPSTEIEGKNENIGGPSSEIEGKSVISRRTSGKSFQGAGRKVYSCGKLDTGCRTTWDNSHDFFLIPLLLKRPAPAPERDRDRNEEISRHHFIAQPQIKKLLETSVEEQKKLNFIKGFNAFNKHGNPTERPEEKEDHGSIGERGSIGKRGSIEERSSIGERGSIEERSSIGERSSIEERSSI